MKVRVLKIGKPADKAYATLVEKFEKRLTSFLKIENQVAKAFRGVEKSSKELFYKLNLEDGRKDPSQYLVCLDERGSQLSSPNFAKIIEKQMVASHIKRLDFVIGGPYGLPTELIKLADFHWSLSDAVFPSDLAWLMVWEQLYRASTIIRGMPYHHD